MSFAVTRLDALPTTDQHAAISAVIHAATTHDGVPPLSEQFLRGLQKPEMQHVHYVLSHADTIVGLAAFDGSTIELVVTPDARRQGGGTALTTAAGNYPVWAHGDLDVAQTFAQYQGREPQRKFLVMSVSGPALNTAADYHLDAGLELLDLPAAYARFSTSNVDEQWLTANNQAFSWHPEQGGWDLDRLRQARNTAWYRLEDVLTLWEGEQLLGFHWTKRHGDLRAGAMGEVYVVGLADVGRGRGLGGPLVSAGLQHLVAEGASTVFLYVEEANTAAVRAYDRLGFVPVERHVLYGNVHETS
ncbi:MAG: mycothiol synthase [Corynebacterium sp.]|nr:mycothiol synthase [Corynebacterium sp.]